MALHLTTQSLIINYGVISQTNCGETIPDLVIYERVSQFSIWIALAFTIGGILLDQNIRKRILFALALFPIISWCYVQFVVDYSRLKKDIFSYNSMAEATLANIAEDHT